MPPAGFIPRQQRWLSVTATLDIGNLDTLGDRMALTLHGRLVDRLGEAANTIVDRAKAQLVPGHGYDTGLMHDTLRAFLVDAAWQAMEGVFYDLESEQARYWVFVEFGHMLANGNWWPGYHFLGNAVRESEQLIQNKIKQAWDETVSILRVQSEVEWVNRPKFTRGWP